MNILEQGPNKSLIIEGFKGDSFTLERLQEMGLHEGMVVRWVQKIPFQGPLILQAGPGFIALRNEEAQCILVTAIKT